ncbi:hypothetical protein SAMN05660649_01474 [Desulfotomaculum arcticum]|uniref:Uncharacterized protein n=1 Tax=Desulfotruncus arcticus DSM 17038 TaxID=1121424 RepID=A0A1I2RDL2_9FIRM|nr:hypothetical protein [Desulfotruncus arcticus]SFG37579.1 hypothetical protein SAMN05660649_01474 [Desulfotomaculum arcticum] [Desulfotruncus arcticus DSM 17038]
MIKQGFVVKINKGVALTGEVGITVDNQGAVKEKVKEKYLKQLAVLKSLYDCEMRANLNLVKGLLPEDIAKLKGIGEVETVIDILQKMATEGLVQQNGGRWSLGSQFPRPVVVEGKAAASLLYEYLSIFSGLVPLPPDLAILKSKLAPLLVIPRRDRWREELAKLAERVIVHGRGAGDQQDIHQVMDLVEQAVYNCRVIIANTGDVLWNCDL